MKHEWNPLSLLAGILIGIGIFNLINLASGASLTIILYINVVLQPLFVGGSMAWYFLKRGKEYK